MIKTKESFRRMLMRKYPDTKRVAIDELKAFIISEPLNKNDAFLYNQAQVGQNRWIVFYNTSSKEALDIVTQISKSGLNLTLHKTNAQRVTAPSYYQNFDNWLKRKGIEPTMRVYKHNSTPEDILNPMHLADTIIKGCIAIKQPANWYVYEFIPAPNGYDTYFSQLPHAVDGNALYVLAKAPTTSKYVSKRAKALQKLEVVEPLEHQLIEYLTLNDEEGAQKMYNAIQQQYTGSTAVYSIDINVLHEALKNGTLHLLLISGSHRQVEQPAEPDFE